MTANVKSKDPVPTLTDAGELYNDASVLYDQYSGDTTRSIARFMLSLPSSPTVSQFLDFDKDDERIILDNACGTGALTFELLLSFPRSTHAKDDRNPRNRHRPLHDHHLSHKASHTIQTHPSRNPTPRNTHGLPESLFRGQFVYTRLHELRIFFLPDPVRGVEEIYRTLKPGGHVYISTWKDLGYLDILREAQRAIRPDSVNTGEEGVFFSQLYSEEWFTESKLRKTLIAGGFDEYRIEILRTSTRLCGMDVEGLIETILVPYSKRMDDAGWTVGERERLRAVIRGLLTEEQKNSASIEMDAFVGVAVK